MHIDHNNIFTETELILTGQSQVYHLHLQPHQLANTVITVGSPDRVAEVSKHFDRIEHRAQHREFITHTGYIGAKPITVISTGIGTGNIDIVLNELDALVNIDFANRKIKDKKTILNIVRLGTCGTLQKDIPVDSLIATTHAVGLDNVLHFYEAANNYREAAMLAAFVAQTGIGHKTIQPYLHEGSAALLHKFTGPYLHGITATCPGFYAPQGRRLRLAPFYPDILERMAGFSYQQSRILNFEMETAAIYGLGKLLGHNCLSVSAALANRATHTFSQNPDAAVEKMIVQSLDIIAAL